jgi:small subunit ribosomal protein S20
VEACAANPTTELKQEVETRMSEAYSKIDKAVKQNVLHRNNAARKKAGLARALKQVLTTAS